MIDSIVRRLPSVLGNVESTQDESFENQGLEHPQFTRPALVEGKRVPEILRSGDHAKIRKWRDSTSHELTMKYRPDLTNADQARALSELDGRLWEEDLDHEL